MVVKLTIGKLNHIGKHRGWVLRFRNGSCRIDANDPDKTILTPLKLRSRWSLGMEDGCWCMCGVTKEHSIEQASPGGAACKWGCEPTLRNHLVFSGCSLFYLSYGCPYEWTSTWWRVGLVFFWLLNQVFWDIHGTWEGWPGYLFKSWWAKSRLIWFDDVTYYILFIMYDLLFVLYYIFP